MQFFDCPKTRYFSKSFCYPRGVQLKICPRCKRPFLAKHESCPKCPVPYTWNQESWANMGCLVTMIVLPLVLMILFWLFLFLGLFIR